MREYMVDILLPGFLSDDFNSKVPEQRTQVDKLMQMGKILNYTLTEDRSKLWVVFNAEDEQEVIELLMRFPIYEDIDFHIHELAFHDGVNLNIPHFSLN